MRLRDGLGRGDTGALSIAAGGLAQTASIRSSIALWYAGDRWAYLCVMVILL
jgi:hypothetical protein